MASDVDIFSIVPWMPPKIERNVWIILGSAPSQAYLSISKLPWFQIKFQEIKWDAHVVVLTAQTF